MSDNTVTIAKSTFEYLIESAACNLARESTLNIKQIDYLLRCMTVNEVMDEESSIYPSISKTNYEAIMSCKYEARTNGQ